MWQINSKHVISAPGTRVVSWWISGSWTADHKVIALHVYICKGIPVMKHFYLMFYSHIVTHGPQCFFLFFLFYEQKHVTTKILQNILCCHVHAHTSVTQLWLQTGNIWIRAISTKSPLVGCGSWLLLWSWILLRDDSVELVCRCSSDHRGGMYTVTAITWTLPREVVWPPSLWCRVAP